VNILSGLVNLRHLIINWDANLKRIANQTFKSLVKLETVDLRGCAISEIEPDAFGCLQNLRHLDLSKNRLSGFSLGQMPVSLEHLNLSSNMFAKIEDVFQYRTSKINARLTMLNLSESGMMSLAAKSFQGLFGLRSLDLSGNYLFEVSDDAFAGLVNIREIDLSKTYMTTITAGLFAETINLRKLNLLSTSVKYWQKGASFSNLRNILQVKINKQELTDESRQVIEKCSKLEFR
jgi:Leucine-rich repeat (LRR) protein